MLTTVVFTDNYFWAVMQNAYQREPIQKIQCESQEMAEIFAQGLAIQNDATFVPAKQRFVSVQRGNHPLGYIFAAIVADRNGNSRFVSKITTDYNKAETAAVKFANANQLIYVPKFFFREPCHQSQL